jgi:hypothetical protein
MSNMRAVRGDVVSSLSQPAVIGIADCATTAARWHHQHLTRAIASIAVRRA